MIDIGWKMATSAVTAVTVIGGASFGLFEYEQAKKNHRDLNSDEIEVVGQAVQDLRKERDLDRFLYLNKLRKTVGLGPNQHREWCELRRRIYGAKECPSYDGRRPRND